MVCYVDKVILNAFILDIQKSVSCILLILKIYFNKTSFAMVQMYLCTHRTQNDERKYINVTFNISWYYFRDLIQLCGHF